MLTARLTPGLKTTWKSLGRLDQPKFTTVPLCPALLYRWICNTVDCALTYFHYLKLNKEERFALDKSLYIYSQIKSLFMLIFRRFPHWIIRNSFHWIIENEDKNSCIHVGKTSITAHDHWYAQLVLQTHTESGFISTKNFSPSDTDTSNITLYMNLSNRYSVEIQYKRFKKVRRMGTRR